MADYFEWGRQDAKEAQFYANRLPPGTMPNSETRATYRAGWIAQRARDKRETLPTCFAELSGRYYWIVSIDHNGNPIYNVTSGAAPTNCAGYRNLRALMELKGDTFA